MLTFLIVAASALAVIAAVALGVAAASRHKKGARGSLDLVGRVGVVEKELRPEGAVMIGGEVWPARPRGGGTMARGARVRVVGAGGHLLLVEPEE
ncbi:MAG: NfeD family protein [Acidobacteria bacterium]|nr:NfeD family protein [Acidobacteriota bacterium]